MSKGDISAPIQAPNGFHILKLFDEKTASIKVNDQQRQEIAQAIFQKKFAQALPAYISSLRDSAYVKIFQN